MAAVDYDWLKLADTLARTELADLGTGAAGSVTNPLGGTSERCPSCGGALLADLSEPESFRLAREAMGAAEFARRVAVVEARCAAGCSWRGYARRSS
jgi:hypothetical protein